MKVSRNMSKKIVRLTENDVHKIVMESVKRIMNEGIYGYPDTVDQIILSFEHDRDCMKIYEDIIRMLTKKAKRGVELDFNLLVNSSVMKKFQQMAFAKFKKYQDDLAKDSPYIFRKYVAEKMLMDVEDGAYDF